MLDVRSLLLERVIFLETINGNYLQKKYPMCFISMSILVHLYLHNKTIIICTLDTIKTLGHLFINDLQDDVLWFEVTVDDPCVV